MNGTDRHHHQVRRAESRRLSDYQLQTVFSPGSVDLLDTNRDDGLNSTLPVEPSRSVIDHQDYNVNEPESPDVFDEDRYLKPKSFTSRNLPVSGQLSVSSQIDASYSAQTTL